MIRNLLYSIFLHIFLLLFILFNYFLEGNNRLRFLRYVDENGNLKTIDIFEIKSVKVDPYPTLSLEDKLNLYLVANKEKTTGDSKKGRKSDKNKGSKGEGNNPNGQGSSISGIRYWGLSNQESRGNKNVLFAGQSEYKKLLAKNKFNQNKLANTREAVGEKIGENGELASTKKISAVQPAISLEARATLDANREIGNKNGLAAVTGTDNQLSDGNTSGIPSDPNDTAENLSEELTTPSSTNNLGRVDPDKIFTEEDIEKLKKRNLDSYSDKFLSQREKFSIQNQIAICYKNALLNGEKNSKSKVSVTVEINKNGYINLNNVDINFSDKTSKIERELMTKIVRETINNCNPLRNLPMAKYDTWKTLNLVFNGNGS